MYEIRIAFHFFPNFPQTLKQNPVLRHIQGMETQNNTRPLRRFNPLNDFLFYKVMGEKGNEPQLVGFLNAVLEPSGRKPIETLEIVEKKPFIGELLGGKSCTLDVRAVLEGGTRVNIEVQLQDKRNMDRRSLYYWSRLYADALKAGQDYRELPDTIAINIVDYDFLPKAGVHSRFRLREDTDPSLVLIGAMEIHFINMIKWREQAGKDLASNPLHRWLVWLDPQSPPELVEEVKGMDGAIAFANEKQEWVMLDAEAREVYEMLQKAERDRRSEIDCATEKGEERKALKIARNALAEGASTEFVQRITGLDMETVAGLRNGV